MIRYRAERTVDHRYFLITAATGARREVPGTTRVLTENNLINDEWFTAEAQARGTLVHSFMEDVARERPLSVALPDIYVGYVASLRLFFEEYRPTVNSVEEVMIDPVMSYGGTSDLSLTMRRDDVVVDVKTGAPEPWHGLQLAAYAWLKHGQRWFSVKRYGLYLKDNGSRPRLIPFDDRSDLPIFFQALSMSHWRIQHGSFERPYGRRTNRDGRDSFRARTQDRDSESVYTNSGRGFTEDFDHF